MKDFIDLTNIDREHLKNIISEARIVKSSRKGMLSGAFDEDKSLENVVVALIFQKPSTRTRFSFEVGIRQMGGTTIFVSATDLHMNKGEEISDTAEVLSRYVDMIVIRASNEKIVLEIANNSTVPVINALTNSSHPCQIMADIMTYEEKRGSIRGKKVVWFGDGNNVCQSFMDASAKFDFNFVFSGPTALKPKKVNRNLNQSCGSYLIEADPKKAIEGADLVVTDTWVSMHDTAKEYTKKKSLLEPYQVNMNLLEKAPSDCILMHCMPIYRGNEVTESVAKKFKSIIIDQAENRLHVQKSIMKWCLSETSNL